MHMPLLAIETATKQLGVAVIDGDRVLSSYELLEEYPHAVELPGAVARVLKAARTTLQHIEAIVVDIGPGSFTGLRIGLAFAKALAFPAKKPLIGVASLDVLAASLPYAARPIVPLLDARQKNLYGAFYRLHEGRLTKQSEYLLQPAHELIARIKEPAILSGDGCAVYRQELLAQCPDPQFAPADLWLPRVTTLARLGAERFGAGQTDNPAKLVPMYLYLLDCSVRGPDRPTSVLPPASAKVVS